MPGVPATLEVEVGGSLELSKLKVHNLKTCHWKYLQPLHILWYLEEIHNLRTVSMDFETMI